MPSAYYRPLQNSLQDIHHHINHDDDDDDGDEDSVEDIDGLTAAQQQQSTSAVGRHHNHHHHHYISPQLGTYYGRPPVAKPSITTTMSRLGRQGANSRRCYLIIAIVIVLAIVYCLVASDIRIGGGLDAFDGDYDPHIGSDSTNGHGINESLLMCSENYEDRRFYMQDKPLNAYTHLPVIYFVTPTYPRREQIPELTRLAHTLLHVPRIHWLVADDQETCNGFLDSLLNRFGIPYTHMASPMPHKYRNYKPTPRGVANRRAALQWLRQHNITTGVLYFGDDDNTYDLKLFSEIRETQRVSMFPVGLIADYAVSGPVVRKGKVIGFLDSWVADRRWPVDMAGFAVNLSYLSQYPNVNMPYKPGYEEDLFLRSVGLRIDQIEPRGNNCTEILVWHTQTKNKKAPVLRFSNEYLDDRSNLGALLRGLKQMGVASASDSEGVKAHISKNGKVKPHSFFLS